MKSKFNCKTCNGAGTIELEDERFCTGCPNLFPGDLGRAEGCAKFPEDATTLGRMLYLKPDELLKSAPLRLSECIEQSIQEAADKPVTTTINLAYTSDPMNMSKEELEETLAERVDELVGNMAKKRAAHLCPVCKGLCIGGGDTYKLLDAEWVCNHCL